jgi:SHS2 domain-containing protein
MRLASMGAGSRSEEHVGEWKVTIWAATLPMLFAEVARVVARSCGPAQGAASGWEPITLTARDDETLLADWANELLGRSEVTALAYDETRFLHVSGGMLSGEIRGHPVVEWVSPLKAATYHGLALERHGFGWRARMLFDV